MSRGPGKMQAFIMETLRMSRTSKSAPFLLERHQLEKYEASKHHTFEAWKKAWSTPARRRSLRMSMGRAYASLRRSGRLSETTTAIGIRPRIGAPAITPNANGHEPPTTRLVMR